jgi:hypothetical protein
MPALERGEVIMASKKKKAAEPVVEESPFDVIEKRFGDLEKAVADLTKTVDMQTDAIKHLHHVIDAVAKAKVPEAAVIPTVFGLSDDVKARLKREVEYANCDSQDVIRTIIDILSQ